MEKRMWEQEYPKMPEAFHKALEDTVKENVQMELKAQTMKKPGRRKYKKRFFFLGVAVVLMLASLTTIAKKKFDFKEYLRLDKSQAIDEIFQYNIKVKVEEEPNLPEWIDREWVKTWEKREDNAPLLDVKEVMFDGGQLCIYGTPTETGKEYDLYTHRLVINGKQLDDPIDTWDDGDRGEDYIFIADVHNLDLECPFEVTLPLSVFISGKNKRSENQDLTFTVDTEAAVTALPDQQFVFDDYTVNVTGLKKSVTSFWGKVSLDWTKKQQKASMKEKGTSIWPTFERKDGTFIQSLSVTDEESQSSRNNQWYFREKLPSADEKSVMLCLKLMTGVLPEDTIFENGGEPKEPEHLGEDMEISLEP